MNFSEILLEEIDFSEFQISEKFIMDQQLERFGTLVDIFTEKHPQPVTSIKDYFELHGLNISRLMLMAYDIKYAIKYLTRNAPEIDIDLYGSYEGEVTVPTGSKITVHKTKNPLTEHINLIYTHQCELPFVWYEPYHIVEHSKDDFGFEHEKDWKMQKRLRPKMFQPTNSEQVNNILNIYTIL